MDQPSKLFTYSIDELWDEIRSRVKCGVLIVEMRNEDEIEAQCFFSGGHISLLGLLEYGKLRSTEIMRRDEIKGE